MYCYRLYTENRNRAEVEAIISAEFAGFTVYETTGYWQGTSEHGLVVEIMADSDVPIVISEVAERIRDRNNQQAVLVSVHEVKTCLVEAPKERKRA